MWKSFVHWWNCNLLNKHPEKSLYIGFGPLKNVKVNVCDHCNRFVDWTFPPMKDEWTPVDK